MRSYNGKTVWIIGASSGIGRALVYELDRRGAKIVMSARSTEKLQKIAQDLTHSAAVESLDVTDMDAVKAAGERVVQTYAPDSVIYLAATYTPAGKSDTSLEAMQKVLSVNLGGAFNVFETLRSYFKKRGKGQIVLCGSVAAYRGLPFGQPYSATKAGILNYAQSLKAEMNVYGIDVRVISPGFVDTGLTAQNTFKMPMIIQPDKAAKYIADGLQSRKFEIHFPRRFTCFVKVFSMLPYWIYFKITTRMVKKKRAS